MRLANVEIDNRIDITLDKSIKVDNLRGIMTCGKKNDYPYIIEKLVNGSITAKAAADVYAKFLVGNGFNDQINRIVIGKDERNKPVTVIGMLSKVAHQMSRHYGAFIHCNQNLDRKNVNVSLIPFKYCRFSKIDDSGYTSKIAVYDNWDKHESFKSDKIKWYNVYNTNEQAFVAQVNEAGGIDKFKGQVYFCFLDNQYIYPLSPFDACYLDMDTENQISIYKNNMTRNGMLKKTVLRLAEPSTPEDESHLKGELRKWQGSDGPTMLTLFDDIDDKGEIKPTGAFKIDTIDSNIDSEAFGQWQKELSNNIRKSIKALPALLIDYEEGKLSTTSGESIVQATNFYNAITKDDRAAISEMFKELLTNTEIPSLVNNQDWEIKPLELYQAVESKDDPIDVKLKSQAELKGSVGGVTALVALQQSVAQGLTSKEAAIATVVEIYGIDEQTAQKMIGYAKPTNV